MYEEVKKHMSTAYDCLKSMVVSHDNVRKVALAEMELELAFSAVMDLEKSNEEQQGEELDGQTD